MRFSGWIAMGLPLFIALPVLRAQEGEQREREEQERVEKRNALQQKLERVFQELKGAKERGEEERANDLDRKAQEIRKMLEGEGRERAEQGEREALKRNLMQLIREADEAAGRGEGEKADALRRKIKDIERKLEGVGREPDLRAVKEKVGKEVERLIKESKEAWGRGDEQLARDLKRKAEEVGRRFEAEVREREATRGGPRPPREEGRMEEPRRPEGSPQPAPLGWQGEGRPLVPMIEELQALRREVSALRAQLERIEGLLRQLGEVRGPRKAQPSPLEAPQPPGAPIPPRRPRVEAPQPPLPPHGEGRQAPPPPEPRGERPML